MKKVIVYIAKDGEQFGTATECRRYEKDGCEYFEPLPKYGDLYPLDQQTLAWMLKGDGSGYYATAIRRSRRMIGLGPHPTWATHLIYFGK